MSRTSFVFISRTCWMSYHWCQSCDFYKDTVITTEENATCADLPPPPIDGGLFTTNISHVTYSCTDEYAFPDGDVTKTYHCSVASLAPLYPCQSKDILILIFYHMYCEKSTPSWGSLIIDGWVVATKCKNRGSETVCAPPSRQGNIFSCPTF